MFSILYNPNCETCRNVLAFLRHCGEEPEIIEYLRTPLSPAELKKRIAESGLSPELVLRKKGTPYTAMGLNHPDLQDETRITAMLTHPILLNRPLVSHDGITRLCRPADLILDLVPESPDGDFIKADGRPLMRDIRIPATDEGLIPAFNCYGLKDPQVYPELCRFREFRTLAGRICGYTAMGVYGTDALIAALVVAPPMRKYHPERSMMRILMSRALMAGARTGWLVCHGVREEAAQLGFTRPTEVPSIILNRLRGYGFAADTEILYRTLSF